MENEHVLVGLIRKRAEIAGELEALEARVADMFASLKGWTRLYACSRWMPSWTGSRLGARWRGSRHCQGKRAA